MIENEIGITINFDNFDRNFDFDCFMIIFHLNVFFITNFLKVGPIRVRFSLGFPPGAGFHG
jgi:hypothetical protein